MMKSASISALMISLLSNSNLGPDLFVKAEQVSMGDLLRCHVRLVPCKVCREKKFLLPARQDSSPPDNPGHAPRKKLPPKKLPPKKKGGRSSSATAPPWCSMAILGKSGMRKGTNLVVCRGRSKFFGQPSLPTRPWQAIAYQPLPIGITAQLDNKIWVELFQAKGFFEKIHQILWSQRYAPTRLCKVL